MNPAKGHEITFGIASAFLVILLVALPFAEWKFIGLPLNGRPFRIDLDQYLSISVFDGIALLFPAVIAARYRFNKGARFRPGFSALAWAIGYVLIIVVLLVQRPQLPWLTPQEVNVIDARNMILSMGLSIAFAISLVQFPLRTVATGQWMFGLVCALGCAVLSVLAFRETGYFRLHYPFGNPVSISFPFPNQNVAAYFISICALCVIGALGYVRSPWLVLLAIPALVLAAALTGSRSNFAMLCLLLGGFVLVMLLREHTIVKRSKTGSYPHTWMVAAGLVAGAALVGANLHWQPVARVVSGLLDMLDRPSEALLGGAEGSPRRSLWSQGTGSNSIESTPQLPSLDSSQTQHVSESGVSLVTVTNGCRQRSTPIYGIKVGKQYTVSLELSESNVETKVTLSLGEKGSSESPIVQVTQNLEPRMFSRLLMFANDSMNHFVDAAGAVSNWTIELGESSTPKNVLEARESLQFWQEPYNGGAGPVLHLADGVLGFSARSRTLTGIVFRDVPAMRSKLARIRYDIRIDRLHYSLPLDTGVLFYTGLSESSAQGRFDDWMGVRNAILVEHMRRPLGWEDYAREARYFEELLASTSSRPTDSELPDFVKKWNDSARCGASGTLAIRDLWKPELRVQDYLGRVENFFGGLISNGFRSRTELSIVPDPSWSPASHLRERGSTHNVYLDWFVYVGPVAAGLFACFVVTFLLALVQLAWRVRASVHFPLIVGVLAQVVLLSGMFYSQPYIWLRYIWVVFGVAGAIVAHPDLRATRIQ